MEVWIDTDPSMGLPFREADDGFALIEAFNTLQVAESSCARVLIEPWYKECQGLRPALCLLITTVIVSRRRCAVGIGLDPANLEQSFTACHTTKPGGFGTGLSMSRSIVRTIPDGSGHGERWSGSYLAIYPFDAPRTGH